MGKLPRLHGEYARVAVPTPTVEIAMKPAALLILASTMTMAAGDAKEAGGKELNLLQGEWRMLSGRVDGVDAIVNPDNAIHCFVKDTKVTFKRGDKVVEEVTIVLDPSKEPKVIDSTLVTKKVAPGIYQLSADRFMLCYGRPGTSRPIDFAAKSGSGHSLSVWERIKK
jgi:uncharacterized protein (TIGR03067 family)